MHACNGANTRQQVSFRLAPSSSHILIFCDIHGGSPVGTPPSDVSTLVNSFPGYNSHDARSYHPGCAAHLPKVPRAATDEFESIPESQPHCHVELI